MPGEPSGLTFADGSVWISSGADGTDLFRIDPEANGITRVPVGEVGPGSFVRQLRVRIDVGDELRRQRRLEVPYRLSARVPPRSTT